MLEKGFQVTHLIKKHYINKNFQLGMIEGNAVVLFLKSFFFFFCSVTLPVALMFLRFEDEYILQLPNPFEKENVLVITLPALIWPTGRLGSLSCTSQSGI